MMRFYQYITITICLINVNVASGQQGQINIPRIESMPDQPSPYNLRDWKSVAIKYDSFVYDANKTGQYLPLVNYSSNGINYPNVKQIKLHTYVGTKSPQNSEAINVLPSLVGAALCGQDLRNTYGVDRLLMSQDFFNKVNGENLYLNNASAGSGGDWWYDVMPNVYFYQLADLFPAVNPTANEQFTLIANKFLEATQKMGGSATPWTPTIMNYRAWNFKTMTGNANGVKEPEAAGAFGWLLYHAYKKTGNTDYLKGAEWSMEYLNSLSSNPSYELQLPYGVLAAAKMNAEIGTEYDISKMVNWCFDRGPLRGWGSIVGKWSSMDVSGLIGEANDGGNDYAFNMNGMQQAAALVPMVRYDKRFAKSIAKWMTNLSNASRLFYPGFLPANQQDGAIWSQTHDTQAVIAHEAMKQKVQNLSPFATGDALAGGWASTNLAIYGSSSVGYLGAIVNKTNVDRILQLDLNVTDFYSDEAYPSYLYFNPFDTPKAVLLDVGSGTHDLYEALSETFIADDKTGQISIIIPPKEAILVVITPSNGTIKYEQNKMLIDEVIIDYNQHQVATGFVPRIKALEASKYIVEKGKTTTIYCTAIDQDSDNLQYQWSAQNGTIDGLNDEIIWTAPAMLGTNNIKVVVKDQERNADSLSISIEVVDNINVAPVIIDVVAERLYTDIQETITIRCNATDDNGDVLTFAWSANAGTISGNGDVIQWTAPNAAGIYTMTVKIDDGKGLSDSENISLLVKKFDDQGQIIAWYPCNGNANDKSGNDHHGTAKGAILTADFDGKPMSAYYFNGGSQHIEVANTLKLNAQDAITISLWCKPIPSLEKETFLISHGSWQNRYKLSITPTGQLRWTINTLTSIVDLDSDIIIKKDSIYHLVTSYDGETMLIFINGQLNTFKPQTGKIRMVSLPLLIGQMLPSDANYNAKGIIDEIKIYNYAIHPEDVKKLYNQGVVSATRNSTNPSSISIYPNPVLHHLTIDVANIDDKIETIEIVNMEGLSIRTFENFNQNRSNFDVSSLAKGAYILLLKNDQMAIIQRIQFIKI